MLCRRHQRFVVEDLVALAFGDVGDEGSDAPQHGGDAPSSPPPGATAEITPAPCLRRPSSSMTPHRIFSNGRRPGAP